MITWKTTFLDLPDTLCVCQYGISVADTSLSLLSFSIICSSKHCSFWGLHLVYPRKPNKKPCDISNIHQDFFEDLHDRVDSTTSWFNFWSFFQLKELVEFFSVYCPWSASLSVVQKCVGPDLRPAHYVLLQFLHSDLFHWGSEDQRRRNRVLHPGWRTCTVKAKTGPQAHSAAARWMRAGGMDESNRLVTSLGLLDAWITWMELAWQLRPAAAVPSFEPRGEDRDSQDQKLGSTSWAGSGIWCDPSPAPP